MNKLNQKIKIILFFIIGIIGLVSPLIANEPIIINGLYLNFLINRHPVQENLINLIENDLFEPAKEGIANSPTQDVELESVDGTPFSKITNYGFTGIRAFNTLDGKDVLIALNNFDHSEDFIRRRATTFLYIGEESVTATGGNFVRTLLIINPNTLSIEGYINTFIYSIFNEDILKFETDERTFLFIKNSLATEEETDFRENYFIYYLDGFPETKGTYTDKIITIQKILLSDEIFENGQIVLENGQEQIIVPSQDVGTLIITLNNFEFTIEEVIINN